MELLVDERPMEQSPALMRAAAAADRILHLAEPPPGDADCVLLVRATAAGPTEPDDSWTIAYGGNRYWRVRAPGLTATLADRTTFLDAVPGLAAPIMACRSRLVLVLCEMDGGGAAIVGVRVHLATAGGSA